MNLEDLIDLEAQIALDRDRDPDALRRRDRTIFFGLPAYRSRSQLLSAWLSRLRENGENPGFGRRVRLGFRWTSRILVVVGLATGWGTAEALLAYREGGPPVNIGTFLLVVVVLQISLLALFAIGWPITRAFPDAPLFGDVRMLLRGLAYGLARLGRTAQAYFDPEAVERVRIAASRIRRRSSLYAPVERWTVMGLSQSFGLAFNVGVLAACLRLVVFSDLAFGWSTTAEAIDADTMHRVVSIVAAPWAPLAPEAVPSADLVRRSRYYRLEGRYAFAPPGQKGDPELVGGWWPFLLAATITYGLVPRLVLAAAALAFRARALSAAPLDTPEVESIVRRMEMPRVTTQGESNAELEDAERAGVFSPRDRIASSASACVVVRWRDAEAPRALLESTLESRFGWPIDAVLDASGADSVAAEIGSQPREDDAIVVVAESWEPPDKGLRRWLADLRTHIDSSRPIYVLLIGGRTESALVSATSSELSVWRDRLELLEDPYLGVVTLEAA